MKIEGLSKDYKIEQGTDVHALRNVSFGLPDKGMIFILGRSGSGKTTLLKLLAGLDKPNSGAVYFHGQNISSFSAHQSDCYRNTYCGFIFQEYNLLPELSVEGNISLSLEMQGEKETKERVKAALEEVGLEGYEKRKVFELSGGQRQRVAIARALIKRPEIIFADEPTGALDKETGRSVLGLLKRLSVERLVLIVTHDREDAEKYGDRIIELEDGAVIGDTEPTQRESEQKGFELRKADLSFKTAFKIGSSNLRHHPIRLCLTLILSVIAFTLFGIPTTLSLWDNERAFIDAVYDNNVQVTSIGRMKKSLSSQLDQSFDRFLGADRFSYDSVPLEESDFRELQSFISTPLIKTQGAGCFSFQSQLSDLKETERMEEFEWLMNHGEERYSLAGDGYIYFPPEAMDYYGWKIEGRLPESDCEIAIPEAIYNTFKFFGFTDRDGVRHEINSPYDIIGEELNTVGEGAGIVKVTGVLYMGCSRSCGANDGIHTNFHNKIYVLGDKITGLSASLIVVTPKDKGEFAALTDYVVSYANGNEVYQIFNAVASIYTSAEGGRVTIVSRLCLYVGLLMLVVAFIFLSMFISVSIRKQLKQIGVLSAMGIDTRGIMKIFGPVSAIICLFTFVFAYALTLIACIFLNRYFSSLFKASVVVAQFHIAVPIILIAILAVVALLGCVVPILFYKRKFAAEIIDRGHIK